MSEFKELSERKIQEIRNFLFLTKINQVNTNNGRFYEVDIGSKKIRLHGVTSILSITSSKEKKEGLKAWRERVGNEEADLICDTSLSRGTVMHDCLDFYYEDRNLINSMERSKNKNLKFDEKYIKNGQRLFIQLYKAGLLNTVKTSIARECRVYNYWEKEGKIFGYSGTVDHICQLLNNKIIVLDYKNSIKEKPIDYIVDYIYQVSAYIKAVEKMTGLEGLEGEIWISCQSGEVQKFELDIKTIQEAFEKFKEKVEKLY